MDFIMLVRIFLCCIAKINNWNPYVNTWLQLISWVTCINPILDFWRTICMVRMDSVLCSQGANIHQGMVMQTSMIRDRNFCAKYICTCPAYLLGALVSRQLYCSLPPDIQLLWETTAFAFFFIFPSWSFKWGRWLAAVRPWVPLSCSLPTIYTAQILNPNHDQLRSKPASEFIAYNSFVCICSLLFKNQSNC